MKKIFKIFELVEISIRDQWGSSDDEFASDHCSYIRCEWTQTFQTLDAAEDFLRDEVFLGGNADSKTIIEIVPVYVKQ